MKKLIAVLLLLMALSGCSVTGRTNITGLLSAPKHSATESEIVKVIGDYTGENIALKYSSSQGYTSPIQLIDVTGDETKEAVVFYHAPNKGTNIRFALLQQTEEGWQSVIDREGLGGDVFWFETVKYPDMAGRQIAVGYLASGISENFFVTYFTDPENPKEDYIEVCEDVVSKDLDGDGYREILLTGHHNDGKTRIKALTMSADSGYKQIGTKIIRRQGANIKQIGFDYSRGEKTVVYIDYSDDTNRIYTEAFTFENSMVKNCLSRENISRAWPYEKPLVSRDIDGDGSIEIPVIVEETVQQDEAPDAVGETPVNFHIEWTDYYAQQEQVKVYGIYNAQNSIFAALPQEWQGQINIKSENQGWKIVSAETENDIVTVTSAEYDENTGSDEYTRIIRKGTKTWIFTFSEDTDVSDIDYIVNSIAVFD